ncbi:glycosyltransferase [Fulvivirga ulvae]|uniref:glycosyltransferase family 2 protein n=1 Tax=Fulvivirga ulvae TaxID=2904245 RepID=UPI001F39A11A|nr:glycosyltransferase [Fulvivirga ulvae]UII30950.1 glycosyltransferase [Fulvivirga ulvae]
MKVSVILPVFNSAATIKRAIDSILAQTFKDFELIVVNDGSTDNTQSIVTELAIADNRIKCYHLTHGGIARALNFGIKMCNSKYIARMDADDTSYPDRLQLQFDYLEKHPEAGLVSGLVKYIGDASKNKGYLKYVEWINGVTEPQQIALKRFIESPFAHPSVFFRRKLIHKFGGYSEANVPEDYELWLRWLHHDVSMHKIDKVLLNWYDSSGRLSRTTGNYSSENFYKVKAYYLANFLVQKLTYTPAIYIWGAGRTVNNRVKPLLSFGLEVSKFIDVKARKDSKFIHFSEIPSRPDPGKLIILSFISDRKGKIEVHEFLSRRGYQEGRDFLMMA